jgi:hypothetical protein
MLKKSNTHDSIMGDDYASDDVSGDGGRINHKGWTLYPKDKLS